MEYANSGCLSDEINKNWENLKKSLSIYYFPENRVWKILTQITLGLYYLHSKDIIHRDIKPGNILIFDSTYVKITDFGATRQLRPGELNAATEIGTSEFSAPETLDFEYNQKSDIWSLGVTIYNLCTTSFPLGLTKDGKHHIRASLHNKLPIKMDNMDKYSLSLQQLILQMLTFEPEKRISAEQILKHPKISSLIKPCIVRKKLICLKNHKLKFMIPKSQINRKPE